MELYLNKKELEIFAKQEDNLRRAYYNNWKSYTTNQQLIELANIYTRVTGESVTKLNCPKCVLDYYKKFGKLYFKSIEYAARSKNNAKSAKTAGTTKKLSGKGKGKAMVTSGEE